MNGSTFFLCLALCRIGSRVLGQLQVPMAAQFDFIMKIRCYACDSTINPECSSPSELQYLYTDCPGIPGESDRCLKTTGPGVLIRRGCGGLPTDGQMTRAADGCFMQADVQVCMCGTEYCNGSSRLSLSFPALFVGAFAFLWRQRF